MEFKLNLGLSIFLVLIILAFSAYTCEEHFGASIQEMMGMDEEYNEKRKKEKQELEMQESQMQELQMQEEMERQLQMQ